VIVHFSIFLPYFFVKKTVAIGYTDLGMEYEKAQILFSLNSRKLTLWHFW